VARPENDFLSPLLPFFSAAATAAAAAAAVAAIVFRGRRSDLSMKVKTNSIMRIEESIFLAFGAVTIF